MTRLKDVSNRKHKQMKCFKRMAKSHRKIPLQVGSFEEIKIDNSLKNSFQDLKEKSSGVIQSAEIKNTPSLKRYTYPSVVVLCLSLILIVFQNCVGGGGDGDSSLISASQTDPNDLLSIKGEYFVAYDQNSLVYLQIDGRDISIELQQNNGGQSLFQENDGEITIVGKNEFKIEYTKESCNSINTEIVKIKPGKITGTLEYSTSSGKNYIFYSIKQYTIPAWVTSITEKYEDSSCSFEFFKTEDESSTEDPINLGDGQNGESPPSVSNISSSYSTNGVSLNQVQQENPCIINSSEDPTTMQRTSVNIRVNIGTVVPNNEIYVGVTSFGDVAAIVGNGTAQPTFVAYLCPRPVSSQGTLYPQITIGAYSGNCRVKGITSANMIFPDGSQANFRSPQYGSSLSRPFTFCL